MCFSSARMRSCSSSFVGVDAHFTSYEATGRAPLVAGGGGSPCVFGGDVDVEGAGRVCFSDLPPPLIIPSANGYTSYMSFSTS